MKTFHLFSFAVSIAYAIYSCGSKGKLEHEEAEPRFLVKFETNSKAI